VSHFGIVFLNKSHDEEDTSTMGDSAPSPLGKRSALLAIGVGGLVAGALDLTQACILFGANIPLTIAAGLLGREALRGGAGTYILGVCLHFFIACSAAAVYYGASRRLGFLREHPLVCGLSFGAAVELVMSLVVLPLSALHARGPYELHDLILGLLVHMVVIGLPISYSVRRFAK
jgi:Na+/alanine symporter